MPIVGLIPPIAVITAMIPRPCPGSRPKREMTRAGVRGGNAAPAWTGKARGAGAPAGGAVGERGPAADDDDPQGGVAESCPADRLAGAGAAVDGHEADGDEAEHDPGDGTGDLDDGAAAVGNNGGEVEGDDRRR